MEDRTQLFRVSDQDDLLAALQNGDQNVEVLDLGGLVDDHERKLVVTQALVHAGEDGGTDDVALGQNEVLNLFAQFDEVFDLAQI